MQEESRTPAGARISKGAWAAWLIHPQERASPDTGHLQRPPPSTLLSPPTPRHKKLPQSQPQSAGRGALTRV